MSHTYLVRRLDGKVFGDDKGGRDFSDTLTRRPGVYKVLDNPSTPDGEGSKEENGFRRYGGANTIRNSTPAERALWAINDATDAKRRVTDKLKADLSTDLRSRKFISIMLKMLNQFAETNRLDPLTKAEVADIIDGIEDDD